MNNQQQIFTELIFLKLMSVTQDIFHVVPKVSAEGS